MPEGKTDQIIRKSEFLLFEFCLLPSVAGFFSNLLGCRDSIMPVHFSAADALFTVDLGDAAVPPHRAGLARPRVANGPTDLAATARRDGLTIATGNDQDFRCPGPPVFNPLKELEAR